MNELFAEKKELVEVYLPIAKKCERLLDGNNDIEAVDDFEFTYLTRMKNSLFTNYSKRVEQVLESKLTTPTVYNLFIQVSETWKNLYDPYISILRGEMDTRYNLFFTICIFEHVWPLDGMDMVELLHVLKDKVDIVKDLAHRDNRELFRLFNEADTADTLRKILSVFLEITQWPELIYHCNEKLVAELLPYGVDINCQNEFGETPLYKLIDTSNNFYRFYPNLKQIKFYLDHGADPYIRANNGKHCIDLIHEKYRPLISLARMKR